MLQRRINCHFTSREQVNSHNVKKDIPPECGRIITFYSAVFGSSVTFIKRSVIPHFIIIFIIMIIIIIIIIGISFMQGIFAYIPETNHVPRAHSVAAILLLLFMAVISPVPALTLLYFHVSFFQSMCAVLNMVVFCIIIIIIIIITIIFMRFNPIT
jgi:hypothetical protein